MVDRSFRVSPYPDHNTVLLGIGDRRLRADFRPRPARFCTPIWRYSAASTRTQFTAMNALTLIDLDNKTAASGNSPSSVVMQLSISLGVACAVKQLGACQPATLALSRSDPRRLSQDLSVRWPVYRLCDHHFPSVAEGRAAQRSRPPPLRSARKRNCSVLLAVLHPLGRLDLHLAVSILPNQQNGQRQKDQPRGTRQVDIVIGEAADDRAMTGQVRRRDPRRGRQRTSRGRIRARQRIPHDRADEGEQAGVKESVFGVEDAGQKNQPTVRTPGAPSMCRNLSGGRQHVRQHRGRRTAFGPKCSPGQPEQVRGTAPAQQFKDAPPAESRERPVNAITIWPSPLARAMPRQTPLARPCPMA